MRTIVFKVKFRGVKGFWRKIELRENQTLVDLHNAIQESLNWTDPHLYSFFMDGKPYSQNQDMEYTAPEHSSELTEIWGNTPKLATVRIKDLNLHLNQKFLYLFDFGDDHEFDIKVVGFQRAEHAGIYPRVVESKGDAPEQYPEPEE